MKLALARSFVSSAMAVSLALIMQPAIANDTSLRICAVAPSNGGDTGMGGTGRHPTDDQGMGGTGQHPTDGQGMGGTGHQAKDSNDGLGFGGTGIVAGLIDEASGPLAVRDARSKKMILAAGDQICPGDTLTTGFKTSVRIRFSDGGRLDMAPNTTAQIDSFDYNESNLSASKNKLSLKAGQIRVVSGLIAKTHADNFLLKTPDGDIRVLGTDFTVAYLAKPKGNDNAGTYVAVDSGAIQLRNKQGPLTLGVGEFGFASKQGLPYRLPLAPTFMNCIGAR